MRERNLTREKALEEYLIYRVRLRELLDMGHIAKGIKCLHAPEAFSDTVGHALIGLFASLIDRQNSALNIFDVWLVLFPEKKDRIAETWERAKPHVQLIRDFRNDIACHANKDLRRYIETVVKFHDGQAGIVKAMQEVAKLAAELMRDETNTLPNLRSEIAAILRARFPNLGEEQLAPVVDYFMQPKRAAE
ncbi:MAG: hypothetical protein WAO35_07115 [Terriglobia bacterium]